MNDRPISVNDINPQLFNELVEKVDKLEKMMYNYDAKGVKKGVLKGIKIQQVTDDTETGVVLSEIYKNDNGGLIKVNDINGALNAVIGSESGTGGNVGGSFILYNDGEGNPRVECGISVTYDAGIINLRDSNGIARVSIYADSNFGSPIIGVRGADDTIKSYLTETAGYINKKVIATQEYVNTAISQHESSYHSGV